MTQQRTEVRRRRRWYSLGGCLLLLAQASISEELPNEIDQGRTMRRANATVVTLVAPFYSVQESQEASLYLLNLFADPLNVEVVAMTPQGLPHSLGTFTVERARHRRVSLNRVLESLPDLRSGSLRLTFWGDAEMLQAWVVLGRGAQVMELPLAVLGSSKDLSMISFWDVRAIHGAEPHFYLVNVSDSPLTLTFTMGGNGSSHGRAGSHVLPPGSRHTLSPLSLSRGLRHGWIRFGHDGPPGALLISGLLESDRVLGTLPVRSSYQAASRQYDSLPILLESPDGSGAPMNPILFLHNPTSHPGTVSISLFNAYTGSQVERYRDALPPHDVTALDLRALILRARPKPAAIRLHLQREDDNGFLIAGLNIAPSGAVLDIPFFSHGYGHPSGSYPLPDLAKFEPAHSFVNLGEAPARILAQISWRGGAYALQPIEIPAGAAYRLDIAALVEKENPDLLGRTLSPEYQDGFFQWTIHSGSHDIIARMEARPWHTSDVFGFNCSSCCSKWSTGSVEPASIAFDIGQNPLFQAWETVHTCNDTMGPFPASFSSLSYATPLSWNGVRVSSTNYTHQQVRFLGHAEMISSTCSIQTFPLVGDGLATVDQCQNQHHPNYDPTQGGCSQQTGNCDSCYDCCDKEKAVAKCRCARIGSPTSCTAGIAAACGSCKQVCFGSHVESCSQQITSCTL